MMQAAQNAAEETARECGFPRHSSWRYVLTSMDSKTLSDVGCVRRRGKQVDRLASLAMKPACAAGLFPL